jgi:hypothetical protein
LNLILWHVFPHILNLKLEYTKKVRCAWKRSISSIEERGRKSKGRRVWECERGPVLSALSTLNHTFVFPRTHIDVFWTRSLISCRFVVVLSVAN